MRKTMTLASVAGLLASLVALPLAAQPVFAEHRLYFGGGLSTNDADFHDNATGWQLFAGYELPITLFGDVTTAIEAGYMDSGDLDHDTFDASFSATGFWATGVARFPVTGNLGVLGRAGWDFGDDDGFMFGAGAGFLIGPQLEVRGEYVVRDNIDSIQANFVWFLR